MLRADARRPDAASGSRPVPEIHQLYATLYEYRQLEAKFTPRLCLAQGSESGDVTTGARDGAAHVLRCLKVWFELPPDVLIHAINLFDRFLTKMKVRPCHVPCITVACMNIAIEQHARSTQQGVCVEQLVSISQSACTAGDVLRMCRVVRDKLSLADGLVVTTLHWLRLIVALVRAVSDGTQDAEWENELVNQLEIVACDYTCANARSSELALVLVYNKLQAQIMEWSRIAETPGGAPVPEAAYRLLDLAAELQNICQMSDASLAATRQQVASVLSRYETRSAAPHRQRLVWRLSSRTLKLLRPTDKLTSLLPTIEEQQNMAVDSTPTRNRSGSESSESEETSDWPRSPVLPVYCDN